MLIFKRLFWTDLSPNTLYRKCIKFGPSKGGSSDPLDPPFPTPLMSILKTNLLSCYMLPMITGRM